MSRHASPEKCPLCGAAVDSRYAPFCSRGCRDRDLLNWLGESYRVAGRPVDPEAFAFDETGLDTGRDPD
ncbi:DNA gyrase inhibitor YacG [Stakelama sp. CBK3Z-3]|uniref:DNA gyrase inhibitor YacG n=1 Tax=Stakelama flava TaxID=2860338 RepID=A0ABS6XLK0_9SPHN|nr:DNA gyrase inhibitor YacG [Stakelama flava]MBW4331089.1 DNA gyrase inhibitor YacG [Stakelama flava]